MAGTYALDIENHRVQNAMAQLGIEESELLIKYLPHRQLEDFAGPRVTEDIQALRYDYHKKKLQETVKKIKYKIREDRQRLSTIMGDGVTISVKALRTAPITTRDLVKSESLASFLSSEEQKLARIKEKQREILLKTYLQTQPTSAKAVDPNAEETDEAVISVKEKLAKKKENFEKKQQRHKEKIKEIRKEKAEMQRQLVQNMAQSMREHEERGRKHEEMKRSEVLARATSYQEKKREITFKMQEKQTRIEEELDRRLHEIEERIEKNRRLHSERLRSKAESAGKWSEKVDDAAPPPGIKGSEEVERIKRYVTAQMQARARKQELATEQLNKFEEQRKLIEGKLAKMENIKKAENELHMKRIRFLERKMKTASMVMEKKKQEWGKELELRMEQQRLMDEDKRTKVERAQRIYVRFTQNLRRDKLLDKLVQDKEKAEKMKKEQQFRSAKHHETAIKIMIERERTKEIQSLVARSPKSRLAQEKLKMLEIKVKEDAVAAEEKPPKEV